jgi:hypothetical protein
LGGAIVVVAGFFGKQKNVRARQGVINGEALVVMGQLMLRRSELNPMEGKAGGHGTSLGVGSRDVSD